MTRIPDLYLTFPSPCPYLDGRQEQKIVAELEGDGAVEVFDLLSLAGFRRTGRWAYRPECPGCSECSPIRVRVDDFTPSRSMRRAGRDLRDLEVGLLDVSTLDEQYELFSRYLTSRHPDGGMAEMTREEYVDMVGGSPVETSLFGFREGDGRLVAGILIDHLIDGESAVYSFFDPDRPGSPGTWLVLWVIARCRELGRPYAYLGYHVAGSPKMAYKARFSPYEIYRWDEQRWVEPRGNPG